MEEISFGLARFWGILIVILSIAMLVNRKMFTGMKEAKENYALIFILGLIALIAGAVQVAFYNVWEFNYRGLITLLGWITVIRASIRLFFPDANKKSFESKYANWIIYPSLIVSTAVGLYLLAIGYGFIQ